MTEIIEQITKLQKLIEESTKILVTSHIAPDPDAVSSTLLLGTTLKKNYPNKSVRMVLEEKPTDNLGFLSGFDQIEFRPVLQILEESSPDLLIVVDANTYKRVSRRDYDQIGDFVKIRSVKTAIIDHHEFDGKEDVEVFINTKRPACAEEVYYVCFEQLGLQKPDGFAQTALLGIISDTQRHKFDNPGYRETYRITADLLDTGVSIEKLESRLERFTADEVKVIAHLLGNLKSENGYTYSYIDNQFFADWLDGQGNDSDLKNAVTYFISTFIRTFENNNWGFLIYPDEASGENWWGVSFRATSDTKDVSALAHELGGGGHKAAAGGKIQANSVEEAIAKVKDVIASSQL